jgi:hypothetical protein
VGGDEHVREGQQPGEHVVLDDLVGQVLEEQVALLLVDVEGEVADLAVLERVDDRRVSISAPRLVLTIITPSFILARRRRR